MRKSPLRQVVFSRSAKAEGYLSVIVALTVPLILSLCLVLIEGARQNSMKLEAECIVDIGVNSVLAEYHREVLEQYQLFYIDTSYGTEQASYQQTEARLRRYIEKNTSYKDVFDGLGNEWLHEKIYLDLQQFQVPSVRITGISLATDNQGYNLQKQAVQAAESDIGIKVIDQVLDWIKIVETENLRENQVEKELEDLEQKLSEIRQKISLEDGEWIEDSAEVMAENSLSAIIRERQKGLLSWIMKLVADSSAKSLGGELYFSDRQKTGQINAGNLSGKKELSLYEKLLFREYLFRYAGDYLDIKEGARLDYQIEYLLFGEKSDAANLTRAAASICGMRETANLLYLMGATEKREAVKTAAALLSTALLMPEAAPVLEGIMLILWSCIESLWDTRSLLKGEKVPLLKTEDSWKSDLNYIFQFGDGTEEESETGLAYEDYLRLFLYFSDLETTTYRFIDIVEMDIRQTEGNQYFRMDACVDYLECEVILESGYGYEYKIKHAKGYR